MNHTFTGLLLTGTSSCANDKPATRPANGQLKIILLACMRCPETRTHACCFQRLVARSAHENR